MNLKIIRLLHGLKFQKQLNMANTKITDLTAITSLDTGDFIPVVDISDSTMASSGTDKKITYSNFLSAGGQFKTFVTVGSANADYLVGNYADVGATINAAYAGLPSTGGTIYVLNGNYIYSTPIVFNTSQKFVLLQGAPAGAVVLTYTGTGTTTALTYNVSKAITAGHGIEGIKFVGPSSSGSTVGIQLGGFGADDSKGAAGITLRYVHVRGFGCNIVTGNNVFLMTFDNVVSNFGGVLFFGKGGAGSGATSWLVNGANTINSGENMRFNSCTFADSNNAIGGSSTADYAVDLQISGITDWNFVSCSFDDAQLYLNMFGGQSNNVHLTNCHFENPAANSIQKYTFIRCIGGTPGVTLDIVSTTFINGATTSSPDQFILNGGHLTLTGCVVAPNYGASTVTRMVALENANNTNTITWTGFSDLSSGVTYIVGTIPNTVDSGWTDGNTLATTITDAGKLTATNFNTILDATTFPGADIGAQINAAYAACAGQQGCKITLPAGIFSFSTPIVFGTNGQRISLWGQGGEATELRYTGTGNAITINTGIQSGSPFISHASGYGLFYFKLTGNKTSDLTQIGVYAGGTNGAAGCILESIDIFGFGIGLETGANTYNFSCYNCVIRNNKQNVYINSASNSGEGMHFNNCFIVDVANNTPTNGFQVADFGCASLIITGGSIDDCQLALGLQIGCTMNGVHMENPSSSWGSYTYITVADSSYSTLSMNGCILMNDQSGVAKPTNFISSNGADVVLNGVTFFSNSGGTITNACVGGRFTWLGLNNCSSCITNIASGIPYTYSGSNQTSNFSNFASKITTYNGISTVGQGVPAIYGIGRVTAQVAAAASIATYTVGSSDGTFVVSGNVNVTTATAHSFTMTVTYTDETNTSRTLTLSFSQITGTILTTITNVTGAGAYEGIPLHIRCKASTAITFATVGTFTTVTYNAEGIITQYA